MALPPVTAPCWHKLATGGLERVRTTNLGTQMLAKRLQNSSMSTADKVWEVYAYYTKWERGLLDEIAQFN